MKMEKAWIAKASSHPSVEKTVLSFWQRGMKRTPWHLFLSEDLGVIEGLARLKRESLGMMLSQKTRKQHSLSSQELLSHLHAEQGTSSCATGWAWKMRLCKGEVFGMESLFEVTALLRAPRGHLLLPNGPWLQLPSTSLRCWFKGWKVTSAQRYKPQGEPAWAQ